MKPTETPAATAVAAKGERMTIAFKLALAWILVSVVGLVIDIAPISASLIDHHYYPIGPDSFYHARRILDAVADPNAFFQFDAHMHAPDGAIVSWPWGYDYVMSLIVRAALALGISKDPMAVLVHIPVLAMPFTLLFVLLSCRALRLSLPATVLTLLGTVLFPLNQALYGIGDIDHHYVEHMLVTATLALGLWWLADPDSRKRAIVAGIVLGLAPAVHTGEFILQVPLLGAFGLLWLRGKPLPSSTIAFAASLLATTMVIALPSLAVRQGHFDFLTLSWFQVYIAFCTALLAVLFSRVACSRNAIIGLVVLCAVLLLPVARQAIQAGAFLDSSAEGLEDIAETRSVIGVLNRGYTLSFLFGYYSYLVLLVPLILALGVWKLIKEVDPVRILFWVTSVLGLLLLLAQLRLHYFGSFALFLPLLVLLDERVARWTWKPVTIWALASIVFLAACSTGPRQRFFKKQMEAGDPDYAMNRRLFESFGKTCQDKPGLVLAHPMDGNYLRFHTNCDVLGTNFLLTPQDIAVNRAERDMFYLPASAIPQAHPEIHYIFVRRDTQFVVSPGGMFILSPNDPRLVDPPLVTELLKADKNNLPAHYRLVDELVYDTNPPLAYARVFAIEQ